ncbi:MAG TPA: lysoplasmalogenase family protein [Pyrinomonadaceae bacterium]|nr:lysoplasmalogenase family protein [Pyrinomonadaceae bacterium]
MTFSFLLRESLELTLVFFGLVVIAVLTQLTKTTASKSLPVFLRALLKAAPALLLTGLAAYLDRPLIAALFLFCSIGDILLDLEDNWPRAFNAGAISFAAALICVCLASYRNQLPGRPLVPLSLTNIVMAIFVLRRALPRLKGPQRILEVSYFGMLIISNIFASTASVPVFLGSSLWFMSDLSIGLRRKMSDEPANSLDTVGLYDVGLYFLAIGFLNS